jgi:hypothetical protein
MQFEGNICIHIYSHILWDVLLNVSYSRATVHISNTETNTASSNFFILNRPRSESPRNWNQRRLVKSVGTGIPVISSIFLCICVFIPIPGATSQRNGRRNRRLCRWRERGRRRRDLVIVFLGDINVTLSTGSDVESLKVIYTYSTSKVYSQRQPQF